MLYWNNLCGGPDNGDDSYWLSFSNFAFRILVCQCHCHLQQWCSWRSSLGLASPCSGPKYSNHEYVLG